MVDNGRLKTLVNIIRRMFRPEIKNLSRENLIKDYSEYSGVSIKDINKCMENFVRLEDEEWDNMPCASDDDKAYEFYKSSHYYVFDLLSADKETIINKLNRFNPLILKRIRNFPGRKFIEFGGGVGVFCQIMAEMGKEVTYLDIPGKVSDFAAWRFKKYNLPIKIIISDPRHLPKLTDTYDIIFSDAVLEHVVDPEGITQELCKCLNKGGLLILLIDVSDQDKQIHMHRHVDINKIHNLIIKNRLSNICGENTFCSIWSKE